MRKIIFSLFATAAVCFGFLSHLGAKKISNRREAPQEDTVYKVYRIDSLHNFYVIYARHHFHIYKIVSQKSNNDCRDITVDSAYAFQLHSYLFVNEKPVIPANEAAEFSGFMVDNNTLIRFEGDSIRNLFFADNIKGLCFVQ